MKEDFELDSYFEREFELHRLKEYYKESSNPLYAWEALNFCLKRNYTIPEWVLRYFEEASSNIMELAGKQEMLDQRASAEVYKALDMSKKGSRNVFDRYQVACKRDEMVARVCSRITKETPHGLCDGEKVTHAIEKVAEEFGVSPETVQEAYYKWKKIYVP